MQPESLCLSEITICNLRSIQRETFPLNNMTALIGYNNAGKTNILMGIRWLLSPFSLEWFPGAITLDHDKRLDFDVFAGGKTAAAGRTFPTPPDRVAADAAIYDLVVVVLAERTNHI